MATTHQTDTKQRDVVLTPRIELFENETEFLLEAELPGVQKEDLRLELQQGQLTLEAVRQSTREEASSRTMYRRHLKFRQPLDADAIEARLEQGVLSLHLPKSPEVQPRQIPVQSV